MITIRPRHDDDIPALYEAIVEQQPFSRYPHRPMPPERAVPFFRRQGELASWVAVADGVPVGHVAVREGHREEDLAPLWAAGHGRPVTALAEVSALFTALRVRGQGAGGRLIDTAVGWIRDAGLAPCLDVVGNETGAYDVYRARGWVEVGRARPGWLHPEEADVVAMILPAEPPV